MRTDDLKLINDVGQALYASPALAQSRTVETVAAVTTLDRLSEEQTLETVTHLLLQRAEKEEGLAKTGGLNQPFYRLEPRERFVLALLKSGRFSYAKIAAMLGVGPREVERIAWEARTQLSLAPEVRARAPHPTGSSNGLSCPEHDPERPWPQRLLDDEMTNQERVFIQNHTVACETCRRALSVARDFYYAIEAQIPSAQVSAESIRSDLRQARLRSPGALPRDLTLRESLAIFTERTEVRLILAMLSVILVYKILA